MTTAAVLPIKAFGRAKSRLSARADRAALAEAMAADVLDALGRSAAVEAIFVVSPGPPPGDDLRWVRDPRQAGHVAAARLGVGAAASAGFERVLLVPGDCPGLDPAEVDELLAEAPSPGVTLVPDRHGAGTNALVLCPPEAIDPSFGPGSFARHAACARAAGLPLRVASARSLLMDVDTPEDLEALCAALPADAAPRTRRTIAGTTVC